MSLLEEHIHETFGRIIIKEEKGESKTILIDKTFILKVLAFLSPSLLVLMYSSDGRCLALIYQILLRFPRLSYHYFLT
jgi:hypothetical protein